MKNQVSIEQISNLLDFVDDVYDQVLKYSYEDGFDWGEVDLYDYKKIAEELSLLKGVQLPCAKVALEDYIDTFELAADAGEEKGTSLIEQDIIPEDFCDNIMYILEEHNIISEWDDLFISNWKQKTKNE